MSLSTVAKKAVLNELEDLIADGGPIVPSYTSSSYGPSLVSSVPEVDIRTFVIKASACIDRIAGRQSQFWNHLVVSSNVAHVLDPTIATSALASLRALRDAVAKDHLLTFAQLVEADVLGDFMAQAETLLDAKYHVAAMVLIGGVLEERLAKLCTARTIVVNKPGISAYNDALRKATVYDQPTWRQIQVVADHRNNAAHGKGHTVKATNVENASTFVGQFSRRVPAVRGGRETLAGLLTCGQTYAARRGRYSCSASGASPMSASS